MQQTSSHSTHSARASRSPGLPRALRRVSPAAVAVTVSLLIGGAGFADAATGGTFILGKANKETSTASLSNSKGTPLALSAPGGKAPLDRNSADRGRQNRETACWHLLCDRHGVCARGRR